MRNMSAERLAMRDPALAIMMGVINGETDFGLESQFGTEFGDDYGEDDEDDDDYGAEFGAAKRRGRVRKAAIRPTESKMMALWDQHHQKMARTEQRELMLEPNKGSATKVETYDFTISQAITMGTAVALAVTGNPVVTIRPQRVSMNAPTPWFAFITEIKLSNVSVTVGSGFADAFTYNANGVGQKLDLPTITPAIPATVLGSYTGLTPPGMVALMAGYFTVSFKGPATIVA